MVYKLSKAESIPLMSRQEALIAGRAMYFTGDECPKGHVGPYYTGSSCCVICTREAARTRYLKAFEADPEKAREQRRDSHHRNWLTAVLNRARKRALTKGFPFSLKKSDLAIPENCQCCGVKMESRVGPTKHGPWSKSPSLDRIENDKGYVLSNVAFICWRCNTLKSNATLEELRRIVSYMERSAAPLRLVS